MLLGHSSSEKLDVTGVEVDIVSEPVSSSSPMYEELMGVMNHATTRFSLDWSVEKQKLTPDRLDEWFLVVH